MVRNRLERDYIKIILRLHKDYTKIILFPLYTFLTLRLCVFARAFVSLLAIVLMLQEYGRINCYKQLTTQPSLQTRGRNDYPKITFTHNPDAMVNCNGRPACRPFHYSPMMPIVVAHLCVRHG